MIIVHTSKNYKVMLAHCNIYYLHIDTNTLDKCRHQLGFIGGTAVSHIQGNLVDLR
jgi:hypothetical protein